MLVLLDENVPKKLKYRFGAAHGVRTVQESGGVAVVVRGKDIAITPPKRRAALGLPSGTSRARRPRRARLRGPTNPTDRNARAILMQRWPTPVTLGKPPEAPHAALCLPSEGGRRRRAEDGPGAPGTPPCSRPPAAWAHPPRSPSGSWARGRAMIATPRSGSCLSLPTGAPLGNRPSRRSRGKARRPSRHR